MNSSLSTLSRTLLLATLGLAACGGGGGGGGGNPPPPPPTPQLGTLVKDLNPSPEPRSSFPRSGVEFQGRYFFAADTDAHGIELWSSDGTDAEMVADIRPGSESSAPGELTVVGNQLFFRAITELGIELWVSDGTAAGTRLVRDIRVGREGSNVHDLTEVGGELLFFANDNVSGSELWKSDGQTAQMVKDVGTTGNPRRVGVVGGKLVFSHKASGTGTELFISDGTATGTSLLADVHPGNPSSSPSVGVVADGVLYFSAQGVGTGRELWRTDGTASGTKLVADINSGAYGSSPQELTALGRLVYFAATGVNGRELYVSNGTATGTTLVADIRTNGSSLPSKLTVVGTDLYFVADDGTHKNEVWRLQTSGGQVTMVKDIGQSTNASVRPQWLTAFGSLLAFVHDDGEHGREVWLSNGTAAGTRMLADLNTQPSTNQSQATKTASSNAKILDAFSGKLVVAADDGVRGTELWFATQFAQDLVNLQPERGGDVVIGSYVAKGRSLYFAGDDKQGKGVELFETDGTDAGTRMAADLVQGAGSSSPRDFATLGTKTLFLAYNDLLGHELHIRDDVTGTIEVADVAPGQASGFSYTGFRPARVGNRLVFAAAAAQGQVELWVTDGTVAGTQILKKLDLGQASSPQDFTAFKGEVYFSATTSQHGRELWRTDGTAAGTVLVRDIVRGADGSAPGTMVAAENYLYFTIRDGNKRRICRTNGFALGTQFFDSYPISDFGTRPVSIGDTLYFVIKRSELWKLEVNATASQQVVAMQPLPMFSALDNLTAVGGKLYFAGHTKDAGIELWSSDGTTAGTAMVGDLNPGLADSKPRGFCTDGTTVWFLARDAEHGRELWRIDPVTGAAELARDFFKGPADGAWALLPAGDRIYVQADDGVRGIELWKIGE